MKWDRPRRIVLAASALGVVAALVMPGAFEGLAGPILLWCGFVLAALAIERFRYKALESERPSAPWVETDERFIDPASGKTVVVFYNPTDGQRKYVAY